MTTANEVLSYLLEMVFAAKNANQFQFMLQHSHTDNDNDKYINNNNQSQIIGQCTNTDRNTYTDLAPGPITNQSLSSSYLLLPLSPDIIRLFVLNLNSSL